MEVSDIMCYSCRYLTSVFVLRISSMVILATFKTIILIHCVYIHCVLLHPPFIVTLLQLYLDVCDHFNSLISYSVPVCLFFVTCVLHLLRIKCYFDAPTYLDLY